tara:strand:+ start:1174 stop:2037 length:864 start_codon:yes stop_codon:yes gene_type:complete
MSTVSGAEKLLMNREREIANKYLFNETWIYVFWGLTNFFVWLSLWPLAIMNILPLWLILLIACINGCLAYLPSHEAQHGNIIRRSSPYFWINEFVGYVSVIPLLTGYKFLRETHMLHHKYTNNSDKDPDIGNKSKNFFHALWICGVMQRQPNAGYNLQTDFYQRNISKRAINEHLFFYWFHWIVMISLAWTGYGLVALSVWWIPRIVGTAYLQITLSWLPHRPMEEQGRYKDTRGWKAMTGTILTQGMEYHIIHHLYPGIPLHRTPDAFRDMRPILVEKECVLDGGI